MYTSLIGLSATHTVNHYVTFQLKTPEEKQLRAVRSPSFLMSICQSMNATHILYGVHECSIRTAPALKHRAQDEQMNMVPGNRQFCNDA